MTYPASVEAAGAVAKAVYDLKTTAGARVAPDHNPADDPLPSGASLVGNLITCLVDATFPGAWDFTGYELLIDGCEVTLSDPRFRCAHLSSAPYHVRLANGATLNLHYATGEMATDVADWGGILNPAGCTVNDTGSHWTGMNVSLVTGAGAYNPTDVYFGAPGNNCTANQHIETNKHDGDTSVYTRVLLDGRDGVLHVPGVNGGMTSLPHNEGGASQANLILNQVIALGAAVLGANYPFASNAATYGATLEMNDVISEAGTSGHVGLTGDVPFTHSNCRDLAGDALFGDTLAVWGGDVVDTTPNAFSFTNRSGAQLSTPYTSNAITVGGINAAAAITVSGGEYSVNGGAFTSSAGTVENGDTVAVRVTSSALASTGVTATLTIGGVSASFTVTTAAPTPPPPVEPEVPTLPTAQPTTTSSPTSVPAPQKGGGVKALARFLMKLFGKR